MGFFKRNRTSDLEAVANAPVGARVTVEGTGAVIGGTLVFENAGDRWVEHRFATDDGRQMWVSIENFDRTVATRWDLADPNAVTGGPDVARAGYQGTPFNRSETGTASFVAKGDTGCSENGSVDFVDFSSGSSATGRSAPDAGRSPWPVTVPTAVPGSAWTPTGGASTAVPRPPSTWASGATGRSSSAPTSPTP